MNVLFRSSLEIKIDEQWQPFDGVPAFSTSNPAILQALGQMYCLPKEELPAFKPIHNGLPNDATSSSLQQLALFTFGQTTVSLCDWLSYPFERTKTMHYHRAQPMDTSSFSTYTVSEQDGLWSYTAQVAAHVISSELYNWLLEVQATVSTCQHLRILYGFQLHP